MVRVFHWREDLVMPCTGPYGRHVRLTGSQVMSSHTQVLSRRFSHVI